MFTLPSSFVGDLTTAVTGNLTTLAPVLIAIGGLIAGFWVVKRIIGLIPKSR